MLIGIPKESAIGERRVATSPDAATQLQKLGYDVCIESGACLLYTSDAADE